MWVRYLEVAVRCERGAADAVTGIFIDLTGGAAVDDPLDVAAALAEGRWDATDLVPGDPRWVTVRGYLPEAGLEERQQALAAALDRVRELGLGQVDPPQVRWVQDEDWAHAWKRYFKPLAVGPFLVIPAWEDAQPAPGQVPIYLDPGMAFGTGQHATTALCLEWLAELVRPGLPVLDVGTGSGILAIAAARLGARPVWAIDIDPVAVAAARENVARNGVDVVVLAGGPDAPAVRAALAGQAVGVAVGNLTAGVVQAVLPHVTGYLAPGGCFLASGIIAERQEEVAAAMAAAGLRVAGARAREGWVALLGRKDP